MTKNVLLVGAGNLGTRYVQGLLEYAEPISIYIVDRDLNQLENIKKIIKNEFNDTQGHSLVFSNSLKHINAEINLVIDATTALNRYNLHREIQACTEPKRWLVEKLLSNSLVELKKLADFHLNHAVWINTPRRIMQSYIKIRNLFELNKPIDLRVKGGGWRLASNSIHFLDLFFFLNRQIYEPDSIQMYVLDEILWIDSHRPGFKEVLGGLGLITDQGNFVEMTSNDTDSNLIVSMTQGRIEVIVNETLSFCEVKNNGNITDKFNIRIELQSQLTPTVVSNILNLSNVGLTDIYESTIQHQILLMNLLKLKKFPNSLKSLEIT